MRTRTTIATVGLVSLLLGGSGRAQETSYNQISNQKERGELHSTAETSDAEYLTGLITDATQLTDAFCRYLQETGIDDTMDFMRAHFLQGTQQEVIKASLEGFDTDTLDVRILQDKNQAICSYEVHIESKVCEFIYEEKIMHNFVWIIDENSFRRVTFVSQTDFLRATDPSKETPLNIAAYEYLARLPRALDRLYVAAVAEDYVGYEVSILELPNIESCYDVETMHVNDDDLMDIAVFDPHVYLIKDGDRKQPSRVYCANEKGHFSNRFCGGKQRELPPHLRIKHPY